MHHSSILKAFKKKRVGEMEVPKMEKPIGQRTRERLAAQHLSPKRRRQIRTDGVVEYINSKYKGCPISGVELMRAAGFNPVGNYGPDYWNGYAFIKSLRKKGIIIKEDEPSKKKSSWRVPEKARPMRPMLQAKVQVVERNLTPEDEVPEKPYVVKVKNDGTEPIDESSPYSFEITVSKRQKSDFGRVRVGQLEMTDITKETARKMINELLDNVS